MTITRNLSGFIRPTAFDAVQEQGLRSQLADQIIAADSAELDEPQLRGPIERNTFRYVVLRTLFTPKYIV